MSKHKGIYHRKVWESHHGPIPREPDGRSYEIHHIDGNHNNNKINNLRLVTIQEHYDIHYSQKDYGACLIMSERMKISPAEKSKLALEHHKNRVARGDHPFLDKDASKKRARIRTERGENAFSGSGLQEQRLKDGTHPSQVTWKCPHCLKDGAGAGNYTRFHGDNCASIKPREPKPKKECSKCGKWVDALNFVKWHGDNCRLR